MLSYWTCVWKVHCKGAHNSDSGKYTRPSRNTAYSILWNELPLALASMSMHTKWNQTGHISTLGDSSLKLVNKFTYLGSSVSSTEKDIDTRLTKAWTAIDKLSVIWKSDLTDKIKCCFFHAAVVSILLYGCTSWTLTKRLEKKLDDNYIRMLRAILNKSWRQHPKKHPQVIRSRHAGHCWRSRDTLIRDVLLWTPT